MKASLHDSPSFHTIRKFTRSKTNTHWHDAILRLNLEGDVDISQSCTRLGESTDPWFSVIEVHVGSDYSI